MVSRFKNPVIILALAIIPYLVFIGSSQRSTVNGVVVWEVSFNLLGAICGLSGLAVAAVDLVESPRNDNLRTVLIVVGLVACVVQIVYSLDLVRLAQWWLSEQPKAF